MIGDNLTEAVPLTAAHLTALTARLPSGLVLPIVAISTDRKARVVASAAAGDLGGALDAVARWRHESSIYVNCGAVEADRLDWLIAHNKRGEATDVVALPCLWADIDIAGPNHLSAKRYPTTEAAAVSVLADLPEPSLLLHTGGGLGAFWVLDEPVLMDDENRSAVAALADGWVRTVARHAARRGWEVDEGVGDLARIMRLGGTLNHKSDPPRPVTNAGRGVAPVHGIDELAEYLDPLPASSVRKKVRPATMSVGGTTRRSLRRAAGDGLNILDAVNAAPWSEIWPADWQFVGTTTVNGVEVEHWRRPGASSPYSATCWPDGGCHLFSDAVQGLPAGTGYSKADVLAWRCGTDLSGLARTLVLAGRERRGALR